MVRCLNLIRESVGQRRQRTSRSRSAVMSTADRLDRDSRCDEADRFTLSGSAPTHHSLSRRTARRQRLRIHDLRVESPAPRRFYSGQMLRTSYTVVTSTSISAIVPAGTAGAVDRHRRHVGGNAPTNFSDRFHVSASAPLDRHIRASGPTAGGT